MVSDVIKSLSTFASLELSTLASVLFLDELAEAYSHKDKSKWYRFFTVRDISLQITSLSLSFSAPVGLIQPIFVQLQRRVHDLYYFEFWLAELFSVTY